MEVWWRLSTTVSHYRATTSRAECAVHRSGAGNQWHAVADQFCESRHATGAGIQYVIALWTGQVAADRTTYAHVRHALGARARAVAGWPGALDNDFQQFRAPRECCLQSHEARRLRVARNSG